MWALIPLTALAIPIVAIICHYAYKALRLYRSTPSPTDDRAAAEMIVAMERMESRIVTLERILDAEAPKWRERA